jgi:tRNA pseudouridine13 synthase
MLPITDPPLLTADLPGIGGQLKKELEDFEVEEIPAYLPSGQGDFLYLWIEKRGMGAEYFVRQVAQRLGISSSEVGTAGLKDRHAVTRQMVSVPAQAEPNLSRLEDDGIKLLSVSRHTNKLRAGHLHGNRFKILIRQPYHENVETVENVGWAESSRPTALGEAQNRLTPILHRIQQNGLPNYYGSQRFGKEGETAAIGLALLRKENSPLIRGRISPFLRKLALSAVQSLLFNQYLGQRLADGLFRKVLPGDVMAKWPAGGMFVTQDVNVEQQRFDRRETVHAGPIFGKKTFKAAGEAAIREAKLLEQTGLSASMFAGFGKLLQGTRRHNVVYVADLKAEWEAEGVWLFFSLPAGSYATVLLREVMKGRNEGDGETDS